MKRVIAILLCLLCAMCLLVACGNDEDVEHTHTYKTNEDWSKDAEGHWYEATCECEDAPISKLKHTDANIDGACDVCTFSNHTHTYDENWTADCTNHWHAASCGCIVAGSDVEEHADADSDGKCDACNYIIEDLHNHWYATEWTYAEGHHWHAALCEHTVEVADKAACTVNAAGYCTVCDNKVIDIDKTDIATILAAAIANGHKIIDGTVVFDETNYDNEESDGIGSKGRDTVFFVLGNGQSYIFLKNFDENGEFIGADHQWYQQISDEEIFGVQMEHGSYELMPITGEAQFLSGYNYIPGAIIPSDAVDTTTLANTLSAIYDIMKAGVNVSDATENYDEETGKYSFAFKYFAVNTVEGKDESGVGVTSHSVEFFNVTAEFTVDSNYVITLANFKVESYRNLEGFDEDLDYDPETNTVTLREDADASVYSYEVSQSSGVRTFTTPYPKASLVPVDFDLSYVTSTDYNDYGAMYIVTEELITGELTLDIDEYVRLHLVSPIPSTSYLSFMNMDDFKVTYTNKVDGETGILWKDQDYLRPSFSGYMNCITFKVSDAGSYTLTIAFGDVVKTIDIVVPEEEVVVPPQDTDSQMTVETTDTYGWFDLYSYTAKASGKYTFTLPAGLGMWNKEACENFTASPELDYQEVSNGGSVSVDIAAGKTFEFYVGAFTKGVWTIEIAFVAGEVDDGGDDETPVEPSDILGTYTCTNSFQGSLSLVIDETTVTFTSGGTSVVCDYKIENGAIVLYNQETEEQWSTTFFDITLTDGAVTGVVYNGNAYTVSAGGSTPSPDEPADITGTYYGEGYGGATLTVVIDETTVTFTFVSPFMGESTLEATYEIVDGAVVLYDEAGAVLNPMAGAITLTAGGVVAEATYNGTFYALSTEQGGGNEEIKVDLMPGENEINVTGDINSMTTTTIVATLDGTYTITIGTNAVVEYDFMTWFAGEQIVVDVAAGEEIVLVVNSEDYTAGIVVLTVEFEEKVAIEPDQDDPQKDALEGEYKLGEYILSLYRDYETNKYVAVVQNSSFTVYLTFTYDVTDNGDNTYTLTPAFFDYGYKAGEENVDAILALDWTISIDPLKELLAGYYVINGYNVTVMRSEGEYVVNISAYDEVTESSVNLTFTYKVVDNGDNTYTFTLTNKPTEYDDGTDKLEEILALEWTISIDPILQALVGTHELNGYYVEVLFDSQNNVYLVHIYDDLYSVSLYFTVVAVDNGNGTTTLNLTYTQYEYEIGVESLDAILALDWTLGEVEGALVGAGTEEAPFVIEELGDLTAEYKGSYTPIWYVFTATQSGYVTLSSSYASPWLQLGTGLDLMFQNRDMYDALLDSVKCYVKAGETVYIAVGDYENMESEASVPFTVSFEAFENESPAFLEGTWTGTMNNMFGTVNYEFTINADGTGTGKADYGYFVDEFEITFVLVDGNTVTLYTVTTGEYSGTKENFIFTYDADTNTLSNVNITLVLGSSSGTGKESDPYILDTLPEEITIVSDTQNKTYYQFVAEKTGTITFTWPSADSWVDIYKMVDGMADGSSSDNKHLTESFSFVVEEGCTYRVGLATYNTAGEFAIAISFVEKEEVVDDGLLDGTYEVFANSRTMTIVIDSVADTISISRSSSGNPTVYTFTYSELVASAVDGTVTNPVQTSGTTAYITVELADNGRVQSVVWNGATYQGFEKVA